MNSLCLHSSELSQHSLDILFPVDDNSGEKIKACHQVVLTFCGPGAGFTLSPNTQRIVRLTLVQTNLGASLHIGIGSIPTKVPNPPQDLATSEGCLSGQVATA